MVTGIMFVVLGLLIIVALGSLGAAHETNMGWDADIIPIFLKYFAIASGYVLVAVAALILFWLGMSHIVAAVNAMRAM